jgi:ABC-type branched-subunit amino acid transport system substrate-binding protein
MAAGRAAPTSCQRSTGSSRRRPAQLHVVRHDKARAPARSLQKLGTAAKNVNVCDSYKPASLTKDPNVKKFVDQMTKTNPQVPVNTFAGNTWAAMNAFAAVASGLDNVTSSALLAALAKSKVATLLGPTVDFTKTVHPELGDRHIYNFTWLYNQVRKGVIVNINNEKFVDPLT